MTEPAVEAPTVDKAGSEPEPWSWSDDRFALGLLGRHPEDLPASAADRAALRPWWLLKPMLSTESAQLRLPAWVQAGAPVASLADIEARLWCIGDPVINGVVRRVLSELPPPVISDALDNYIIVTGSPSGTRGFMDALPSRPRAADAECPVLLMVTGTHDDLADVAKTVAHEVAHAWLEPRWRVGALPATLADRWDTQRKGLKLAAVWERPEIAANVIDEATAAARRVEARALALGAAWGFPFTEHEAAACIMGARMRVAAALGPRGRR